MRSSEWSISFLRQLFSLTSRYWRSEEKKSAYAYLLGIVTLTIAAVYMTLLLNDWFNEFYSALQNYDADAVYHGLIRFTGLAFAHIAFAVYAYYLQQQLALRWRRWLTEEYLARWTEREMYYRMDMFSKEADNPDQRISEDINLFTARTLSFMAGLLKAITTIVCFIFVLWQLSEPLPFTVGGETYHVYGYLVWAALIYSLIGTWITHRLVGLNFVQQKLEADFRYAMVRLRETAESVAFYDGAARERGDPFHSFRKADREYDLHHQEAEAAFLAHQFLWADRDHFPLRCRGAPLSFEAYFLRRPYAGGELLRQGAGVDVLLRRRVQLAGGVAVLRGQAH